MMVGTTHRAILMAMGRHDVDVEAFRRALCLCLLSYTHFPLNDIRM